MAEILRLNCCRSILKRSGLNRFQPNQIRIPWRERATARGLIVTKPESYCKRGNDGGCGEDALSGQFYQNRATFPHKKKVKDLRFFLFVLVFVVQPLKKGSSLSNSSYCAQASFV